MTGGLTLIALGSALGLLTVVVAWRRLPATVVLLVASVCGAAVGAGGLLVQETRAAGDWVVALVALGVLTPLHCRLVFGPPGPMVAAGRDAA